MILPPDRCSKSFGSASRYEIETAVKVDNAANATVQRVRTHARLLESMPTAVSKATALKIVAKRLGVTSGEAIAFGDGDNDVPLFEWCGVSVAMSHGWPAAIAAASHITPEGDAETALARGVDMMFDAGVIASNAPRPVRFQLLSSGNQITLGRRFFFGRFGHPGA